MTTITAHVSSAELEARYKRAVDPIGKSHFHALWLLSCGYEVDEVAELLSFSSRWVRALVKRYNAGGAGELGDQRSRNATKPTILTPDALAALTERIKTPPDDGGLWTGPKIARRRTARQPLLCHHRELGPGGRRPLHRAHPHYALGSACPITRLIAGKRRRRPRSISSTRS